MALTTLGKLSNYDTRIVSFVIKMKTKDNNNNKNHSYKAPYIKISKRMNKDVPFTWKKLVQSTPLGGPGGGALPYVGGYQMPVNRPPFFTSILHPMTPFFYSVHTQ